MNTKVLRATALQTAYNDLVATARSVYKGAELLEYIEKKAAKLDADLAALDGQA